VFSGPALKEVYRKPVSDKNQVNKEKKVCSNHIYFKGEIQKQELVEKTSGVRNVNWLLLALESILKQYTRSSR